MQNKLFKKYQKKIFYLKRFWVSLRIYIVSEYS